MGRLCGGAHEISALRPHFFSVVGGLKVPGVGGWVGGGGGGGGVVVLVVVGVWGGGVMGLHDTPNHGGC